MNSTKPGSDGTNYGAAVPLERESSDQAAQQYTAQQTQTIARPVLGLATAQSASIRQASPSARPLTDLSRAASRHSAAAQPPTGIRTLFTIQNRLLQQLNPEPGLHDLGNDMREIAQSIADLDIILTSSLYDTENLSPSTDAAAESLQLEGLEILRTLLITLQRQLTYLNTVTTTTHTLGDDEAAARMREEEKTPQLQSSILRLTLTAFNVATATLVSGAFSRSQ